MNREKIEKIYVDSADLEKISSAIKCQSTIFNEDLNDYISNIL